MALLKVKRYCSVRNRFPFQHQPPPKQKDRRFINYFSWMLVNAPSRPNRRPPPPLIAPFLIDPIRRLTFYKCEQLHSLSSKTVQFRPELATQVMSILPDVRTNYIQSSADEIVGVQEDNLPWHWCGWSSRNVNGPVLALIRID